MDELERKLRRYKRIAKIAAAISEGRMVYIPGIFDEALEPVRESPFTDKALSDFWFAHFSYHPDAEGFAFMRKFGAMYLRRAATRMKKELDEDPSPPAVRELWRLPERYANDEEPAE